MMEVLRPVLSLVLAAAMLSAAASAHPSSSRISFQQLLHGLPANLHKHLRDSNGVLRITIDDGDVTQQQYGLKAVRKRALSHLCSCPTFNDYGEGDDESSLFQQVIQSHPKDVQQINLPDGTIRRTLASATVGFDNHNDSDESQHTEAAVLELPSWIKDKCGEEAYDSFEELRDIVAKVTDAFVAKLDGEQRDHFQSESSKVDQSYRSVLANANHLEHFHVYTKAGGNGDTKAASGQFLDEMDHFTPTFDYHTDAGFFLSFVPAMDCRDYKTDDSSFYLKGETDPLTFEEDEVIILMGAGAQYWLSKDDKGNEQYPFLAASHALRLKPNTHRSWYGKMHLLPSSMQAQAFATPSVIGNAKFGDVLPDLKLENYKAHVPTTPVDGCGTAIFQQSSPDQEVSSSSYYARTSRRRLQHVNSPANCNNVTNFFCWHQCIDIPNSEYVEDYVRDGYSLYCLDPSIMVSTDNSIPQATDPCKGGYAHNSNCVGSWQGTDESVPGYHFPGLKEKLSKQEANYPVPEEIGEQYCYGGTSMYMDGFHWLNSTCVILLFPSWVLSTPFKFGMACFGAIIFGILLELVLYKRRTVYALPAGYRRLALSALVYGVQLAMGYFIMLLVMTYSGPLFVSCILGMVAGHVLFNAQDALVKMHEDKVEKKKTEATMRASELSSYQNGGAKSDDDEMENGGSCCGLGAKASYTKDERELLSPTETTKLKMPSGATPCCQYTMENQDSSTAFVD